LTGIPLLGDPDSTGLSEILRYAAEDELLRDYLISSNKRMAAIVVSFKEMTAKETCKAVEAFEDILKKHKPPDIDLYITGSGKALSEYNRLVSRSMRDAPTFLAILIFVCMVVLLRSVFRAFAVLANAAISVVWTLGFYSLLKAPFNGMTIMIIPIAIILSVADCIHIMEYFDELHEEENTGSRFIHCVKFIILPCFITSVTTAMGLLSLSVSRIKAVRYFGIGASAGVMFAFITAIVTIPLVLQWLPQKRVKHDRKLWQNTLNGISNVVVSHRTIVIVIFCLVFILSLWGALKIHVETNQLEWFPHQSSFYKSTKLLDEHLMSSCEMSVLIQGDEGSIKNPDVLMKMDNLAARIREKPCVNKVVSLSDYVKKINKALHEDSSESYMIPSSQPLVAQELFLFSLSDYGGFGVRGLFNPTWVCRLKINSTMYSGKLRSVVSASI